MAADFECRFAAGSRRSVGCRGVDDSRVRGTVSGVVVASPAVVSRSRSPSDHPAASGPESSWYARWLPRPVHESAASVAAQLARDDAGSRPRPSSGITVIEADNQPRAVSSGNESSLEPVDDGPPMPFEPLDPPDDEQARAREEAEARELETLRRRDRYGRRLEM